MKNSPGPSRFSQPTGRCWIGLPSESVLKTPEFTTATPLIDVAKASTFTTSPETPAIGFRTAARPDGQALLAGR